MRCAVCVCALADTGESRSISITAPLNMPQFPLHHRLPIFFTTTAWHWLRTSAVSALSELRAALLASDSRPRRRTRPSSANRSSTRAATAVPGDAAYMFAGWSRAAYA